ncbi:MAG: molybdopterin molybdotransferase MoeA [Deltaproteobacteria bacterium]|nr:molybdopterin molybdotransferase MoeA [Deltaproteobacteria bacterium]
MISVDVALTAILKEIEPLGPESVHTGDTLGRVLFEDVHAGRPNPPWDNSAMDGYALRSADTKGAKPDKPVTLKVVYDLPAGGVPKAPVGAGEAVRIMTGAPVPDGADAVVMVEMTNKADADKVAILAEAKRGDHIRKAGEDFTEGAVVLKKTSRLRPADIAMLATIGAAYVFVHKRPRVAVISTGDELVELNETPAKGKISNSNGYALAALVKECGAIPIQMGIARDTKESLKEKLSSAMCAADMIISSGGVSVGDFDFVKDVLKEMGSRMVFWKVAMKPGKPLAFGVIGGKPSFGLPGNPVSSMVAFEQFVKPAIQKMSGTGALTRNTLCARLTKDITIKPGRTNFIRAALNIDIIGPENTVTPLEGQGSGMILTMVSANSYIIVPAESSGFKKGEMVRVQPFDASILTGRP